MHTQAGVLTQMAVPASALGSGRQRHLLSEAQAAAEALRDTPLDAAASQVTDSEYNLGWIPEYPSAQGSTPGV